MTTSIQCERTTIDQEYQARWRSGGLLATGSKSGLRFAEDRSSRTLRDSSEVAYVITDNDDLADRIIECFDRHRICSKLFRSVHSYLAYQRPSVASCVLIERALSDLSRLDSECMLKSTEPPIIFISDDKDIPDCVQAIKKGAHDFLTMPLDPSSLMEALTGAFQRDRSSRLIRLELEDLISRWRSLTRREAEVMRYAVGGFLNKQTAAELNIAENTVQVHRGRVMQKMSAASFADLVRMTLRLEVHGELQSSVRGKD